MNSVVSVLTAAKLPNVPVLFVPGNRDLSEVPVVEGTTNIDLLTSKGPYQHLDLTFAGIGGSNYIQGQWPYEWHEQELETRIEEITSQIGQEPKSTVLLCHDAPWATLLDKHHANNQSIGSSAVRKLIDDLQPRLFLCGHIHESAGFDVLGQTLCINAGNVLSSEQESAVFPGEFISFQVGFSPRFFLIDVIEDAVTTRHYYTKLDAMGSEGLYCHEVQYRDGSLLAVSSQGMLEMPTTGISKAPPKSPAGHSDQLWDNFQSE